MVPVEGVMVVALLFVIAAALIFGGAAVKNAILTIIGLVIGSIGLAVVSYTLGINPFIVLIGLAAIAAVPLWFLDRDRKKDADLDERYEAARAQLTPELREKIDAAKMKR
jgi:membrane protein implicated in regulation of membrane protease activity